MCGSSSSGYLATDCFTICTNMPSRCLPHARRMRTDSAKICAQGRVAVPGTAIDIYAPYMVCSGGGDHPVVRYSSQYHRRTCALSVLCRILPVLHNMCETLTEPPFCSCGVAVVFSRQTWRTSTNALQGLEDQCRVNLDRGNVSCHRKSATIVVAVSYETEMKHKNKSQVSHHKAFKCPLSQPWVKFDKGYCSSVLGVSRGVFPCRKDIHYS